MIFKSYSIRQLLSLQYYFIAMEHEKYSLVLLQREIFRMWQKKKKTASFFGTRAFVVSHKRKKKQNLEPRKSHRCEGGEENHLSSTVLQINGTHFTDFIKNYIRCSYAKREVNKSYK